MAAAAVVAASQAPSEVYLDNQATTPCDPEVVAAMLPFFTQAFANAASEEHAAGRRARDAVEEARAEVAALIDADPREIIFTSGATESNNLAIKGFARAARGRDEPRKRIITLSTEHACVLESVRTLESEGFEALILPVLPSGLLDASVFEPALTTPTLLVSVMGANNEIGTLHDLATLARLAASHGAAFHSDLAQLAGKLPLSVRDMGLNLASLSAHKMYGPKGIGALYLRRRPRTRLEPLLSGGAQERGLRAGTAPVPLIVGFGAAARIAKRSMEAEARRLAALRDRLHSGLRAAIPAIVVNGSLDARLPGNLNITFPDRDAASLMATCPLLCVSSGSACSVAELSPSHVLQALGLDDAACRRSLRLSIGRLNSADDVDRAVAMLTTAHEAPEAWTRLPLNQRPLAATGA